MNTQSTNQEYHPKVFISYSWDSTEHKKRVLNLSNRLREAGIDCMIDQYVAFPLEGWPLWMINQVKGADFVLLICTEKYYQRFMRKCENDKSLGVILESQNIIQELYEGQGKNSKFIPIIFSQKESNYIPDIVRSYSYYLLDEEHINIKLYCLLTRQSEVKMNKIGKLRSFDTRSINDDHTLESLKWDSTETISQEDTITKFLLEDSIIEIIIENEYNHTLETNDNENLEKLIDTLIKEILSCKFLFFNKIPFLQQKKEVFNNKEIVINKLFGRIKKLLLRKEYITTIRQKLKKEKHSENGNDEKLIGDYLINILLNKKKLGELKNNYTAGNILNLLLLLKLQTDFSYFDLSNISIWDADLQDAILTGVDFTNSDLKNSSFSKSLSSIHSIAFSSDGSYFATGDADGSIRVNNTENLELCFLYNHRRNQIWSVAFSSRAGKQRFAWGAEDGRVELFEIDNSSGKLQFKKIGSWNESRRILSVAFSPDGNTLAFGGDGDKAIKVFNISNRDLLNLDAIDVSCITFISNTFLASSGKKTTEDGYIHVWNIVDRKEEYQKKMHRGVIRCIAFNKNRKILASGGEDGKVKLLSTDSYRTLPFDSPTEISQVRTLAFSQDGNILAVGCIDKNSNNQSEHKIRLWNSIHREWEFATNLDNLDNNGHKHLIRSLAFCPNPKKPNSQLLISGGDDRTIKLWDNEKNQWKCKQTLRGYSNRIWSIAFSRDGYIFACGGEDNKIRLWNYWERTHIPFQTLSEHTDWVWSVAFNEDGTLLASASEDNNIYLWKLEKEEWKYFTSCTGHNKRVRCVAFNPKRDMLASGGNDNKIFLWNLSNVQNPKPLREFTQHSDRILSLAFSPNGQYLVSSSRDKTIHLIDLNNTQNEQVNLGSYEFHHKNQVHSIAFSPNSNKLVSGDFDRKLKLWDVESRRCLNTWDDQQQILSVAFHPKEPIVASAGHNHIVTLWDIENENDVRPIKILKGHKHAVESIVFSHDGNKLISCSQDQTIKFWEVEGKNNISIHTIELGQPYQGMNISGVTNLNDVQMLGLEKLGATKY
ncbi:MAG: SEFIR domain-containing protein [Nostoc sp.]|uniref:WD40 domain-containing protein n=1 Tax=Nostoc sp. TaxID=1180 RepID=UPI002FF8710D